MLFNFVFCYSFFCWIIRIYACVFFVVSNFNLIIIFLLIYFLVVVVVVGFYLIKLFAHLVKFWYIFFVAAVFYDFICFNLLLFLMFFLLLQVYFWCFYDSSIELVYSYSRVDFSIVKCKTDCMNVY